MKTLENVISKEQANAQLALLVEEVNKKLREAEEFATKHRLEFTLSTPKLSEKGDNITFVSEVETWGESTIERTEYIGAWNSSACW